MSESDVSRRDLFLRGGKPSDDGKIYMAPPWTTRKHLAESCTGCGNCVDACPEEIISLGPDGLPVLSFDEAGCTFCRACVMACEEPVFSPFDTQPFPHRISVGANCLSNSGVACQSCADACPSGALDFDLRVRPVGAVVVKPEKCTGCGMCQSVCPVAALEARQDPAAATNDRRAP